MLRCKRLDNFLVIDTFFSNKKANKSSRGNACCKFFVTNKGFVYVVPIKSKSEVILAMKQFANDVGASESTSVDASNKEKYQEAKQFINNVRIKLRVLEEGNPQANRMKLCIGLLKEAVRKDTKEENSPIVFWDYCVE